MDVLRQVLLYLPLARCGILVNVKKTIFLLVISLVALNAQQRKPKPAFPGQTEAPPPSKLSGPIKVETIATGLNSPWAMAFLPDGHILVTENAGTMRIVNPAANFVSAPLAGVPPVKAVAAQGLHDLLLDPDFAQNRTFYFTYFAPPKGEAAGSWPIEDFYEKVWTKPFTERRTMQIGFERIARAQLSKDLKSIENVDVLAEGAERRIVLAPDGTLFVTGADRFRFYDSDLDGVDHDFTDNPDIRRNFSGRVLRINRDGSIPKDNPWLSRATVPARYIRARLQRSRRRGDQSADGRALGDRSRPARWRRGQHRPRRQGLRLARCIVWSPVRCPATGRPQERSGRQRQERHGRRGAAHLFLGAVHRAFGDGVLYRRLVSRMERQPVHRRDGGAASGAPGSEW